VIAARLELVAMDRPRLDVPWSLARQARRRKATGYRDSLSHLRATTDAAARANLEDWSSHRSKAARLVETTMSYFERHNGDPKPIVWTKLPT